MLGIRYSRYMYVHIYMARTVPTHAGAFPPHAQKKGEKAHENAKNYIK